MLLLTLRGTPFLYQGEELGLRDGVIPADHVVDIEGRDPERCPMPWQSPSAAGSGAGFTSGRPWLPIGPDAEQHNVARECADPASVLSLYRRLLAVRRQEPALRSGQILWLDSDDADVLVYRRSHGESSHLVVLNLADRSASVSAGWHGRPIVGIVEVSTSMEGLGRSLSGISIDLEPYEGLVIREQ